MLTELPDPFDRTSRYLLRRNAEAMLVWLLTLAREQLDFVQWLDTRRIPWPGQPERTCDTVAHVRDMTRGGLPWALVVEFQLEPDPDMFGRALSYLGQLWLDLRPSPHPGDRFCVAAVAVNLTGRGHSSRDYHWAEAGLRTNLTVRELDLEGLQAEAVLDGVEAGAIPRVVLAWTPLMQGGDNPAILQRWLSLASLEPDANRRADLGLALVFAEAAGRKDVWKKALEGWNVTKSTVVQEWIDLGVAKGEIRAKVGTLLRILQKRFDPLPEEVTAAIQGTDDTSRLDAWIDLAVFVRSLDQFRHDAGL